MGEAPLRLLYVVTEDWYFLSHRLPMARAARDAGFDVHVATRVVDGAAAIIAEGFVLHPVPFVRGRISPLGTIATIRALRRVHRAVAPAIAHHVDSITDIKRFSRGVNRVGESRVVGFAFMFDFEQPLGNRCPGDVAIADIRQKVFETVVTEHRRNRITRHIIEAKPLEFFINHLTT